MKRNDLNRGSKIAKMDIPKRTSEIHEVGKPSEDEKAFLKEAAWHRKKLAELFFDEIEEKSDADAKRARREKYTLDDYDKCPCPK